MNVRSIITIGLGIILIGLGYFGYTKLSGLQKKSPPPPKKKITSVYTQEVENKNTPIYIETSGQLVARDKVEIFSEVQGIFEYSSSIFKPGAYYKKGEVLLKLNNTEFFASIQAQKSSLYNQIVALLPDLQLDFPESLPNWKNYLENFDLNKDLQHLPEPLSEKEKLFIAGRNIQSTWYNIKNQQVRLKKYVIYAPFNGVITEANVTPGTLVRAGQKLGEFINPNVFEMEVPVNVSFEDRLKIGKQVALHDIENTTVWNGVVTRINGKVDPASQTVIAFIQVKGDGLKEGMYLQAEVRAKDEANTFEIDRKLLLDQNKVFVVKDSLLELREITPVFFNENTVVIKGLADGTKILANPVPGAYSGMKVKSLKD